MSIINEIFRYIIPIIAILIFILSFVLMLSPKARAKWMSKQIKAEKYMTDIAKDDIKNISKNMAEASKEGVEITANAVKKGFTKDDKTYCKNCGNRIDEDSKFCKICGKEQ